MLVRYCKAGANAFNGEVPDLTIEVRHSIEDLPPPARGRQMDMDAACLCAVLRNHLPQRTLDRLTWHLMNRFLSEITRAYGPAEDGGTDHPGTRTG